MSSRKDVTWVLEPDVFPAGDILLDAARRAGHRVVAWDDAWWANAGQPSLHDPVVFHGSLANADRVHREGRWKPGAYCRTAAFHCSSWYPRAREYLLHSQWEVLAAEELVASGDRFFTMFGVGAAVFVRPDSPLKPFSGRVIQKGQLSLAALDHGFYYQDSTIPVVVAPVCTVLREWRYVVVQRNVVAGSSYEADGRRGTAAGATGEPWEYAARVAARLEPPEDVYVLDVCETPSGLRLLELNPFSGADLYASDGGRIVSEVATVVGRAS